MARGLRLPCAAAFRAVPKDLETASMFDRRGERASKRVAELVRVADMSRDGMRKMVPSDSDSESEEVVRIRKLPVAGILLVELCERLTYYTLAGSRP